MPPPAKFDDGVPGLPGHMFQSATELIAWKDLETPACSYPAAFQEWCDSTEAVISEILELGDMEAEKDIESFAIGKKVAFRAFEKFLSRATATGWSSQGAEARAAAAEALLALPQIPQRTQAWYAQGKEVLTASEFAKLLGTPRSVSQLVMSKVPSETVNQKNRLACMSCEMGPFDWGIRFEPVVKQILTANWGVTIAEAGRILHPTDPRVAASPDGIYLAATDPARVGRLVEIKCPITRQIGEGVPFEYWCQMQVQMEVTGVEECDYVEVKLDSIQGSVTDLSGQADGHIWLLQRQPCDIKYSYTEEETVSHIKGGWELMEKIPWRLNEMYAVTVTRDRAWFKGTEELREQFWKNVELARKGAFQVVEGRKVIVHKEPACLIQD